MRRLGWMIGGVVAVVVLAGLAVAGWLLVNREATDRRQEALQPFYTAPDPLPTGPVGTLLRAEPLTDGVDLPNGSAYRILYLTEGIDSASRVASGRLFIPNTPAPASGRPVVSWAHPTSGMGDDCAPSRTPKPTSFVDWLGAMMDRGWLVVATDYAGLGTEGVQAYLVAQPEVYDVVNAVRAARQFEGAEASSTYAVFGHSQGGHASLWAGTLAPAYAPELTLVGVAGAAPAAPLADLVSYIWDTDLGWLIGAEVMVSYPANFAGLDPAEVLTEPGLRAYAALAEDCIDPGGVESDIRQTFGERFFSRDPLGVSAWAEVMESQSAPPVPATIPVLVTQSVNDGVIAPKAIADMTERWCAAGSVIDTVWLGPLRGSVEATSVMTHIYEGVIGGFVATTWLEGRFAGEPAPSSCDQSAPLVASSEN